MARVSSAGGHDGGGAEEGAGHQRPPGEDEEEPGGDREGPAAAPGRGREPGPEGRQEAAPETGDQGRKYNTPIMSARWLCSVTTPLYMFQFVSLHGAFIVLVILYKITINTTPHPWVDPSSLEQGTSGVTRLFYSGLKPWILFN